MRIGAFTLDVHVCDLQVGVIVQLGASSSGVDIDVPSCPLPDRAQPLIPEQLSCDLRKWSSSSPVSGASSS